VDKWVVLYQSWWEEEGETDDYGHESDDIKLWNDKVLMPHATWLPCQLAEVEFRVVAIEISTRDLVQEYLANRMFPTSSGWGMLKKKEGEKVWACSAPYRFKFEKQFKKPCNEWLEMIETMCNEILGNYTKKEDQLMTAAFGTRPKQRMNRVMDALNFEYLDYEKLDEGVGVWKERGLLAS
jgi:hypothetical protein